MKKIFLLCSVLSVSFSFAQKEAVIMPASSVQAVVSEDNTIYTKMGVEVHQNFLVE